MFLRKNRASINVFLIDVIHNGVRGHWSHKVRVPWNLSLDIILVLSSLIFDRRHIAKKLKWIFQAGVELCLYINIIRLLYNLFYIISPYIFPPLIQPAISSRTAIFTWYWCLSLQGLYVFVFLVCNYSHNRGFIGQILLQQSNIDTEILSYAYIICGP